MDALAFLKDKTKTATGRWVFIVLCLLPVVGGIVGKLISHAWAFMDVDALLCAARAEAAGHSPYGILTCPDLAPAPYVYAPQVAALFAPAIIALGGMGSRIVYTLVFLLPATTFLVWYSLGKAMPRLDWRYRWLAFSALTPMAFYCANIGLVMHAVVAATLMLYPRRRLPFVAAVLACAFIKPTFLLYFAAFLFEERPLRERLATFGSAAMAGLGVVAVTAMTAGTYAGAWHQALSSVALETQPGLGWFALTSMVHLPASAPMTLILTVIFMGAMLASALALAEWGGLSGDERKLLALGVAPLMTPRLMDYDMFLIVPYVALLMSLVPSLGGRTWRTYVSWGFAGMLLFGIVCNIVHLKHWPRTHAAMFVFCVLTMVVGARIGLNVWEEEKKKRAALAGGIGKGQYQRPSSVPASFRR